MDLISAREAADKWGISQRRVAVLCSENRIKNAKVIGNMWLIPANAQKPADARCAARSVADSKVAKPFLKWAGGKSQLLDEIVKRYPFDDKSITKYVEPFVGGGAVLFDVLSKYKLDEIYISDINAELINTYCVIRDCTENLIDLLRVYQAEFVTLGDLERKEYYNKKRERFNALISTNDKNTDVEKAALMIFINRTCFNGLYRVNKKGLYNVPIGSYKNPLICDEINLRAVAKKLKNVKIKCADYKISKDVIDSHTLVYIDPPYRPLTSTSSFTAYTENQFCDDDQAELAKFVDEISLKGAKVIVSNSDPKNTDADDNFFDDLYSGYHISRVEALRMINSNSKSRGKIKELLITNY